MLSTGGKKKKVGSFPISVLWGCMTMVLAMMTASLVSADRIYLTTPSPDTVVYAGCPVEIGFRVQYSDMAMLHWVQVQILRRTVEGVEDAAAEKGGDDDRYEILVERLDYSTRAQWDETGRTRSLTFTPPKESPPGEYIIRAFGKATYPCGSTTAEGGGGGLRRVFCDLELQDRKTVHLESLEKGQACPASGPSSPPLAPVTSDASPSMLSPTVKHKKRSTVGPIAELPQKGATTHVDTAPMVPSLPRKVMLIFSDPSTMTLREMLQQQIRIVLQTQIQDYQLPFLSPSSSSSPSSLSMTSASVATVPATTTAPGLMVQLIGPGDKAKTVPIQHLSGFDDQASQEFMIKTLEKSQAGLNEGLGRTMTPREVLLRLQADPELIVFPTEEEMKGSSFLWTGSEAKEATTKDQILPPGRVVQKRAAQGLAEQEMAPQQEITAEDIIQAMVGQQATKAMEETVTKSKEGLDQVGEKLKEGAQEVNDRVEKVVKESARTVVSGVGSLGSSSAVIAGSVAIWMVLAV